MNLIIEKIRKLGIVPAVVINNAEDVEPIARALCDGGLPVVEVAFHTEVAEDAIRIVKERFRNMTVGAGAILTIEQLQRAINAGAEFIVCSELNMDVMKYCHEREFPIITDGSWTVNEELVKNKEYKKITELTRQTVMSIMEFELKHIGINCNSSEEAHATTDFFKKAFGFEKKDGESSVFAGTCIEAMKTPYLGKNGHIAIGTNDIDRAMAYLSILGIEMDMETKKYKDGKMIAIYFKEEVSGFALHLLQK